MKTMLYFIKSGNYCKVGYTKDSKALFSRMQKYLTHNPSFQILDLKKGNMEDEKFIHTLIPNELYHYGEWCVWNKQIAEIWLDSYKVKPENGLEDYFYTRNRKVNKAIVSRFKSSPNLNFIRYFNKESNLDLTEPDATEWRAP